MEVGYFRELLSMRANCSNPWPPFRFTTRRNCNVLSGPKYKIMLDLNDSLDKTDDRPNEHILNLEYWNHDNEQGMSFVTFFCNFCNI